MDPKHRLREHETATCQAECVHTEQVEQVRLKMPEEGTLYDLADFFKVLGDSTRVRILWALDCRELCVCDLCALLGMTKSAVSHQLRALRMSALVTYRRSGKNVFYTLADEHVRMVLEKAYEHILE